jgi:hypothetical protein
MPPEIELQALELTSARLANLLQTATETLPNCSSLRLRFEGAELVATRLGGGLLCVLADDELDRKLLSVATRALSRRLSAAGS